jgi:undecaprenyl diphosphate synthase
MIDISNIPKHVAIIMDGNGRWARERNLPRIFGHREGIKRVKEIVKVASGLGVKVVTFFAFSSENWSRPKKEIEALMRFLNNFLDKEIRELDKNNIRFLVIGKEDHLPQAIVSKIKQAQNQTEDNSGMTMALALNYGSRQEIIEAVKKACKAAKNGELNLEELSEEDFSRYLYTCGLPDPDLFIRTSGEMRISNFLLWQLSYAELYFAKKYWPDFKEDDFKRAIAEYQKRERRFGGINADKKNN